MLTSSLSARNVDALVASSDGSITSDRARNRCFAKCGRLESRERLLRVWRDHKRITGVRAMVGTSLPLCLLVGCARDTVNSRVLAGEHWCSRYATLTRERRTTHDAGCRAVPPHPLPFRV